MIFKHLHVHISAPFASNACSVRAPGEGETRTIECRLSTFLFAIEDPPITANGCHVNEPINADNSTYTGGHDCNEIQITTSTVIPLVMYLQAAASHSRSLRSWPILSQSFAYLFCWFELYSQLNRWLVCRRKYGDEGHDARRIPCQYSVPTKIVEKNLCLDDKVIYIMTISPVRQVNTTYPGNTSSRYHGMGLPREKASFFQSDGSQYAFF